MDDIVLTPEPEQKSYWRLIWAIIFVILMIPGVIILVLSEIIGGVIYIVPVIVSLLFVLYWIPLYYSSMKFFITGEHIIVEKGVWWNKETTIPFERITNVDKTHNPFERYYKIGKIHVQTAGAGRAEAVIQGIKNLDEVREKIKDGIIINRGEPMPKEVMIQESKGVIGIIIILGTGISMLGASFLLAYFAYNSASEIKDYNIFIIKILFLLCMIGIGAYLTEKGVRLPYLLKRRK